MEMGFMKGAKEDWQELGSEIAAKDSQMLRQNTIYVSSVWLGRLLEYSPFLEQSNGKIAKC